MNGFTDFELIYEYILSLTIKNLLQLNKWYLLDLRLKYLIYYNCSGFFKLIFF